MPGCESEGEGDESDGARARDGEGDVGLLATLSARRVVWVVHARGRHTRWDVPCACWRLRRAGRMRRLRCGGCNGRSRTRWGGAGGGRWADWARVWWKGQGEERGGGLLLLLWWWLLRLLLVLLLVLLLRWWGEVLRVRGHEGWSCCKLSLCDGLMHVHRLRVTVRMKMRRVVRRGRLHVRVMARYGHGVHARMRRHVAIRRRVRHAHGSRGWRHRGRRTCRILRCCAGGGRGGGRGCRCERAALPLLHLRGVSGAVCHGLQQSWGGASGGRPVAHHVWPTRTSERPWHDRSSAGCCCLRGYSSSAGARLRRRRGRGSLHSGR